MDGIAPGYGFSGQNIENVVGNGRLIARATAGSVDFIFAGAADRLRLLADDTPVDELAVDSDFRPGFAQYVVPGRLRVTHAAAPEADLYVLLAESLGEAAALTLEVEAPDVELIEHGVSTAWGVIRAHGAASDENGLTVALGTDRPVVFLIGAPQAAAGFDPRKAAETVAAWSEGYRTRGLQLRTPYGDLDRAVPFMKYHMQLGYDWKPGGGGKMVCDIFRWRDVWSRDFGSGFGPGAIVANRYDAVLETLDYEVGRHARPAWHYKVSEDTSQGGSAEGLGWLMKLIWRVYKHTGDQNHLRRMIDAFEPWMQSWIARDADRDGLIVDVTEWMDHSRYLRLPEGQRTLYSNVLYYAALRRFRHAYAALGDEKRSAEYHALANQTRQAIHDAFWNEAGYFNNAIFWGVRDTALMLADNAIAITEGIASRNERFRTLETIRERNWRTYGSVTCDVPMRYIEPENDHNVKVWPWWMAHEAKARFMNYDAEGGLHVLSKILYTLDQPTYPGLCEEYLNPDDGAQDDVVGHAFITGAGATLDALLYGLVGLRHFGAGDRMLRLAPQVPRAWSEWRADIDLYQGRLAFEQSPDAYRIDLDGTRVETLELRVPPRESLQAVTLDGRSIEPERYEDGASEFLRVPLEPGATSALELHFTPRRTTVGVFARPSDLPEPLTGSRPAFVAEPRLFADVLQGFVRNAASYFGQLRHVAAAEVDALDASHLLVVAGNELPFRTRAGEDVPPKIEAFFRRGGSALLLGPRFARIDAHTDGQMGEKGGAFWWKVWHDGHWVDYDPREGTTTEHPLHDGTVYWGPGPLFQAWEQKIGLFGFQAECRGVFDVEGHAVDAEQRIEIAYSDFAVRRPWTFHPLAFTERAEPVVTGPRAERYPCAALLHNVETGSRVIVVAPTIASRADLLHRVLRHVVLPEAG